MLRMICCILGAVLLLVACGTVAQTAGPTPTEPVTAPVTTPPLATPQLIATEAYTAVVFPATRGPEFAGMIGPVSSYWTPTRADMARLEAGLADYLRRAAPAYAPDLVQQLPGATGQFVGVISDGRKEIYGSFFCARAGNDNLLSRPVFVLDGGSCYFQLRYDVEADRFSELIVNGDA